MVDISFHNFYSPVKKNVKKKYNESQKNILLYYIITNICSYVKYWSFNKNTARTFNTIRLRFGRRYVGKPNQTKTKTKTKTKTGCCCYRRIFNRRIFNRRIFNRLILCPGFISVSVGFDSVSIGFISVSLGFISDILGFISDIHLYKFRSDFKAINLSDDK